VPDKRHVGFHLAGFAETSLNNRLLRLSPDAVMACDLCVAAIQLGC
jgi:hypothetical protein